MATSFRSLDAVRLAGTVGHLRDRVRERFPGSGLSEVADELLLVAQESVARSAWVRHPILWLRAGVVVLVTLLLFVLAVGLWQMGLPAKVSDLAGLAQMFEAGINDIILIGAGVFFLVTLETRIKRKRVLRAIHELRSLAHIVDMHQLTKDPYQILVPGTGTASSPQRTLTAFDLSRYLVYCTELLSHIGKVAALHVEAFDDPVTLEAVDDIEDLTTGLSRKIWQKIAMMDRAVD